MRARILLALPLAAALTGAVAVPASGAAPAAVPPAKVPTATGTGGAVATVDPDATRVGLQVLRNGGNAVDAAVAAAATLGVTEPFSAGIGGGGYFVYYEAKTGRVHTLDGRETGPASLRENTFTDASGAALPFQQARVSGLSVGVPGTPKTWQEALSRWGTSTLGQALAPAAKVASDGFVVDQTFHDQIAKDLYNPQAFATFSSTKALYLPGGKAPAVGTVFTNPDLAATYRQLGRQGIGAFYGGAVGADLVATVQKPPVAAKDSGWPYPVAAGGMTLADLRAYDVIPREPTHVEFRGLDVYGMAPSSSGGTTVGEALKIIQRRTGQGQDRVKALHTYLEASALAFADRNRWVADPAFVRVPQQQLLSSAYARQRACLIELRGTLTRPVAPGVPDGDYGSECPAPAPADVRPQNEGMSTTNLTVADKDGNVVEYTLTIEQTGGSGIVVPGRGFLLNNELTDFSLIPTQGEALDPNLPAPGKRPRSSMAPTIVLRDGQPFLALGSPGGSTIITTVLQILLDRVDLGLTLPQAVADARISERNNATTQAEPAFVDTREAAALRARGHVFEVSPTAPGIGAATAVEFLRDGRLLAAAEPTRRGGGSAGVVSPAP
ncbi:MAG TPA: gamma-glutamyltransferase [Mycobacteriales bacterium]|nr:gamma-glutamyltransferase [Mycobacteriales bacterium]